MKSSPFNIDQLVELACQGNAAAMQELFATHRVQLKRMVSVRMDPQLQARFDPSDVVQDALIVATRRLADYAKNPQIAFYPWLRQIAWERLVQLKRHHRDRQKRSVNREEREGIPLPDQSAALLVDRLISGDPSVNRLCVQREMLERAKTAMNQLPETYREVLVLRHLEQLSVEETASVMGVSIGTIKSRHFRAIQQLNRILGSQSN